jgi:magnesium transporter
MKVLDAKKRLERWHKFLKKAEWKPLYNLLKEAPKVEVADFMGQQKVTVTIQLFAYFPVEDQAALFSHFNDSRKKELYDLLSPRTFLHIFIQLPSDSRVDFYQQLDEKQQTSLLPFLPKYIAKEVIMLSAYPPDTAGGIMSTDFATVRDDITVQAALAKLREDAPSSRMIYHLYVVNEEMKMIGFISLRSLVMSAPETTIASLVKKTFVYAQLTDDREKVAQKIQHYNLVALPVLNEDDQLAGIVDHDDAMDVLRTEQTEDMEKFMGIVSNEEDEGYLRTSSLSHFKKRIGWLAGLFGATIISGLALNRYGGIIKIFPLLGFFTQSINDTGGNAGSQAATVVIRALSLGELQIKDWVKIVWKEFKIALLSVSVLFSFAIIRSLLVINRQDALIQGKGLYMVALVISLSVALQVVASTLIGAMLPLFITWMGKDPALAASPAITTIVDLTGMLIYCSTAVYFLG